jgi:hypothetical protein
VSITIPPASCTGSDVAARIAPDERDDPQAGLEGLLKATVILFGENEVAAERPSGQRRRLTNHGSSVC